MRKKVVWLAASLSLLAAGNAVAASLEAMQGAWTMDMTDCAETFETVGGKVRFKDRGSSRNTGIIVSRNRIEGPSATCTATRVVAKEDRLAVLLSCADEIMSGDMSFSFKMIDGESFERFDPFFKDVFATYHRCSR